MKTSIYILFVATLITLQLFSCKKDPAIVETPLAPDTTAAPVTSNFDTVFPLSYLPVYPGSYWKYRDSQNNIIIDSTRSTYQMHINGIFPWDKDTTIVPYFKNIAHYGYQIHFSSGSTSSAPYLVYLVQEAPVGTYWSASNRWGTTYGRKIIAVDSIVPIGNSSYYPTIVVEETVGSSGGGGSIRTARRYFTKDIGIVKEEFFIGNDSISNTKELFEFFVNR